MKIFAALVVSLGACGDAPAQHSGLQPAPDAPPAPQADAPTAPDAPSAPDLPLLTAADIPDRPVVQPTCDATSVAPAPPGHHPGACDVTGLGELDPNAWDLGDEEVIRTHRDYEGSVLFRERTETWFALHANDPLSYHRTNIENMYSGEGRLLQSLKYSADIDLAYPDDGDTYLDTTTLTYDPNGHLVDSTTTGWFHNLSNPSVFGPIEHITYTLGPLGKPVEVRDETYDGDKITVIGYFASGVERSDAASWLDQWDTNTESHVYDEAGHIVQHDYRGERTTTGAAGTLHETFTYSDGRLAGHRVETKVLSSLGEEYSGDTTVETYTYDGARLVAIDATTSHLTCTSTCTAPPATLAHTAFRYDAHGNLVERAVTDGAGNLLSRWTAVADQDANLLCELQTFADPDGNQVLAFFRRYDYGCFASR